MITRMIITAAMTAALFCPDVASTAVWGDLLNGGAPVMLGSQPTAVFVGDSRSVVAGLRLDGAVMRIFAIQVDGTGLTTLGGGLPVDWGSADHRRPVLVPDGSGHAALLYESYAGTAWNLYASWFDGVNFSVMNGGAPVDLDPTSNVTAACGAFISATELAVFYTKRNGSRTTLLGAGWGPGGWTPINGGLALDDPAGGFSEDPAATADGWGGAVVVYTQQDAGTARLRAARWDGTTWTPLNGGSALDRSDLGASCSPRVAVRANGTVLIAYLQEDENYVTRLFAVEWNGTAWIRLNGGVPLDATPSGVGALSIVPCSSGDFLIGYATSDQVSGTDPAKVFCLKVTGAVVSLVDDGRNLKGPGSGEVPAMAMVVSRLNRGFMFFEETAWGGVLCRSVDLNPPPSPPVTIAPVSPPPPAALVPGPGIPSEDGITMIRNVFRPGSGERVNITCSLKGPGRVRLAIYSVSGRLVRMLADSDESAGMFTREWDGRNDQDRHVAPGVYLLMGQAGGARRTEKVVVR
jgi:hypothetical protein